MQTLCRNPEKLLASVVIWLGVLAWLGCTSETAGELLTPPPVDDSRALLTVNGERVDQADFLAYQALVDLTDGSDTRVRRELLRDFIGNLVLYQQARRFGVLVEESEVRKYLETWGATQSESIPNFEVVQLYLTANKYLRKQIQKQVEVSLQEMLNFYELDLEDFEIGDQAHVLEILLEEEGQAEQLRADLSGSEVRTFKQAARQYSLGVTADLGGDLGYVQRGDLPEEFESVIFSLKLGEVSEVFQSTLGYHLFLLEEWIPRHSQKFYEVQSEIFLILTEEKERLAIEEFMEEALGAVSIEVYDPQLKRLLEGISIQ